MKTQWIVETAREADGRWIAEIPAIRGVLAYGATKAEAVRKVVALAECMTKPSFR